MNNAEREVYLILCMTGREQEALEFRKWCEEQHRKERKNEDGK